MAPTIRATTRELLDQVAGTAEFDLVTALAFPLPAYTIFSLMGVPKQDWEHLKRWCGYRAALSWGRPAPEDQVEIARNIADYRRRPDQRAARHPRRGPRRLTLAEIASILFSLSFAGHETTTGLIGNLHGLPWRSLPAGSRACGWWRASSSASTPTSPSFRGPQSLRVRPG